MNVIAIYPGHNATVSYFEDGICKKVIHEEKFSYIKNQMGFPHKSLDYLMKLYDFKKVDYFTFPFIEVLFEYTPTTAKKPAMNTIENNTFNKVFIFLAYKLAFLQQFFYIVKKFITREIISPKSKKAINNYLSKNYNVSNKKVLYYDHHLSNVLSVVYFYNLQNFDKNILIFSMDSGGDGYFAKIYIYNGISKKIINIANSITPASLGLLYTEATAFVGMKKNEHEYEVMGLAAYVSEEEQYKKIYDKLAENIFFDKENLVFSSKFNLNSASIFFKENFTGETSENISAGLQHFLEDIVINWIKAAIKKTGIKSIACTGGIFMNVKLNKKVQELQEIDRVYFMPSCGEESMVLGCAALPYFNKNLNLKSDELMFKGFKYINSEVETFLKQKKYDFKYKILYFDDIELETVKLLKNFEVVARFNGTGEWGARSLCNRCIMGNASDLKTIYIINKMIKMRDSRMPFAPTILVEWAERYIKEWAMLKPKVGHSSKYMITCFDSTELAQEHLKAAIHPKDKTLRPQLVEKSDNPNLYRLLKYYEEATGMGGLLNTSFNIHGYPLLWSLEQAIFTFENSGLKYMTLENYLISKP